MGNIWTIARQTISEALRMKLAVFLIVLIGVLLFGLPFVSQGDASVSGAVQSFLVYAIMTVTFLLCCLSIFMCKSISDDLSGRQITMLMTKPIARWQYVLGKWSGIMLLNAALLLVSGVCIYGLTRYIASQPPRDEWDKERLETQVLVARHATPFIVPDFSTEAAQEFERRREEGRYVDVLALDPAVEKERLRGELEARWRSVGPLQARRFDFEDVRTSRDAENTVSVQYEARTYQYPPDEIVRCMWRIGNRDKETAEYDVPRRDVRDRKHSVTVPADVVAADNTLTATFVNVNPFLDYEGEEQWSNTVVFEGGRAVEALFSISSFESNLVRALTLVLCRLAFLAAASVLAASLFSFPVACLVALCTYMVAASMNFITTALDYLSEESPVVSVFSTVMQNLLGAIQFIIPNFAEIDATQLLVEGRNVTLMWVLVGLGKVVVVKTGVLLLAACLVFQRRQVAEVSV